MAEIKPDQPDVPQVKDKRVVPPGILPKNTQTLVELGKHLVGLGARRMISDPGHRLGMSGISGSSNGSS